MSVCETFTLGSFKTQCSRIELIKAGEFPLAISGPGEIYQNDDGGLEFKIHLSASDYSAVFSDLIRPRTAGRLIPDEDWWQLSATSYSGGVWTSKVPDLGASGDPLFGPGPGMVHGRLPMLAAEQRFSGGKPTQEFAKLFFPGRLSFPATERSRSETSYGDVAGSGSVTADHAKLKFGNDDFLIAKCKEHTWIQCLLPPGGVNQNKHRRIQEALMFALGQTIRPCATETYTHEFNRTELWSFSKAKPTYLPKQLPPLFFDDVPPKSETFEIAACYYNAICEWTADIWHELTGHVYYLIHSASTVMEMSSLTLAVTAEGLAENCFPATGHPAEGFSDAVADLESKVGQLTKNPDLQKRLQGTLGAMRRPRNSDRLRELVTNLDIDQKVFKSWQRLRNAAAHGSVDQGDDHAELHSQNMELLYLCYRIVLAHIGYHGPATDYSKTGFPNVII